VIEQKTYNLFQVSTPVLSALSVPMTICDAIILIVNAGSRKKICHDFEGAQSPYEMLA